MPTLSKLSDKCKKCKHVDDCDEKRMVACAIAELPPSRLENITKPFAASISMPVARENTPITINMGEYGKIETSMEEINERIEKNLYKQLYYGLNRKL